jgi:hypothetical protein
MMGNQSSGSLPFEDIRTRSAGFQFIESNVCRIGSESGEVPVGEDADGLSPFNVACPCGNGVVVFCLIFPKNRPRDASNCLGDWAVDTI